ncbi:Conserved hypothetical protein, predicted transmembrane protein [Mycoplasma mycoides subsp. capri LC str. 95010]|uniref:Uncharacterized protein n=1 Tax=Mycoplasma mycoides subsp. capri LC str. 95010 TaxID=862259 RepID=F4MQV4_MYCML|nr:hypothetical protein [Mycoplasma mycoides]CBW54487.1 Conserved hypothetical protein, predicted transmembrane protein [Mycoplasma mycoides subsp. capri LC str. 95010]
MFYYATHSVLIQINKLDDNYLIGDQVFKQIPGYILNSLYTSANWNRALKYYCLKGNLVGYYMLNFDIYLDFINRQVNLLTKNSFFTNIINQNKFKTEFLQKVLDHKHRHRLVLNTNFDINNDFIIKTNPTIFSDILRIASINRFFINQQIDLNRYKFKDVLIISDKFEFVITNKNQRIYKVPKDQLNIDNKPVFIDLVNKKTYLLTVLNWSHQIVLELEYEDINNINDLQQQLIKIFKNNFATDLNWHLYNLTLNETYLVTAIREVFENNSFILSINVLEQTFKKLLINYFFIIFRSKTLIDLLKTYIRTEDDNLVFNTLLTRYNK